MGRSQAFDSAAAVSAARDCFWRQGYEETSLADLERATGLNRSSLYNTFSSKRGLYDLAVQDYLDAVVRPRLEPLLTAQPGSHAAAGCFRTMSAWVAASAAETGSAPGCLLLNSAAGLAAHDERQRAVVDAYYAQLTEAMAAGLAADSPAGASGQLAARARLLVSLLISALLLSRVNPAAAQEVLAEAAALATTT
ncbi:TetR/AcrR family transcriptional regulator [Arthrobacter sp. 35W]|uniref:TetR/AcrR family transcriptional regulator n=1 Tax=Arthrobacter sp. 35W TaxID=1132441 RepID=UPI00054E25E3|nr:TetR/AcrR family transcriptional regulator [Arthrobacter sp. 35W]